MNYLSYALLTLCKKNPMDYTSSRLFQKWTPSAPQCNSVRHSAPKPLFPVMVRNMSVRTIRVSQIQFVGHIPNTMEKWQFILSIHWWTKTSKVLCLTSRWKLSLKTRSVYIFWVHYTMKANITIKDRHYLYSSSLLYMHFTSFIHSRSRDHSRYGSANERRRYCVTWSLIG